MNLNYLRGLSSLAILCALLEASCSSDASKPASTGTGGSTGAGNTGGNATGGVRAATGGTKGNGGTPGAGGTFNDPDASSDCATPVASRETNCGSPTVVSGSFTVSGNYFKVGTYAGYGFDYISPTPDPTNSVTCANSTFGSGTLTALCGAGTVPADCTNNAVGGVGFNLAQPKSGGDPAPAITMQVQQVVVTFTNTANSDLHIQIVKYDGTTQTNYCYAAKGKTSPLTISANEFTTTCYLPDDPGSPWDGSGAESFQLIVPSRAPADGGATPFDLCLQNVEFS